LYKNKIAQKLTAFKKRVKYIN